MKVSKLLKLLFGLSGLFSMGIVEEGGGAGAVVEGGEGAGEQGAAGEAAGAGEAGNSASKISDAEAKLLKEVMDKKTALRKTQDDLAAVNAKLQQFDGIDAAEVRKLLQDKKDAEAAQLEAKGEFGRVKQQMVEEHNKTLTEVNERVKTIEQALAERDGVIAELTVGNAFGGSEFIKGELLMTVNKARLIYGSHFEYKDGAIVAFDKPAGSAQRTVLVDAQGEPLAFEAAIAKIVDADADRDSLLRSKVKTGANSKTVQKAEPVAAKFDELSGTQKIAAALAQLKK